MAVSAIHSTALGQEFNRELSPPPPMIEIDFGAIERLAGTEVFRLEDEKPQEPETIEADAIDVITLPEEGESSVVFNKLDEEELPESIEENDDSEAVDADNKTTDAPYTATEISESFPANETIYDYADGELNNERLGLRVPSKQTESRENDIAVMLSSGSKKSSAPSDETAEEEESHPLPFTKSVADDLDKDLQIVVTPGKRVQKWSIPKVKSPDANETLPWQTEDASPETHDDEPSLASAKAENTAKEKERHRSFFDYLFGKNKPSEEDVAIVEDDVDTAQKLPPSDKNEGIDNEAKEISLPSSLASTDTNNPPDAIDTYKTVKLQKDDVEIENINVIYPDEVRDLKNIFAAPLPEHKPGREPITNARLEVSDAFTSTETRLDNAISSNRKRNQGVVEIGSSKLGADKTRALSDKTRSVEKAIDSAIDSTAIAPASIQKPTFKLKQAETPDKAEKITLHPPIFLKENDYQQPSPASGESEIAEFDAPDRKVTTSAPEKIETAVNQASPSSQKLADTEKKEKQPVILAKAEPSTIDTATQTITDKPVDSRLLNGAFSFVAFDQDAVNITENDKDRIEKMVQSAIEQNRNIQILSHASNMEGANAARRISLKRGINIRQIMVDAGFEKKRITVKLGDNKEYNPSIANTAQIYLTN